MARTICHKQKPPLWVHTHRTSSTLHRHVLDVLEKLRITGDYIGREPPVVMGHVHCRDGQEYLNRTFGSVFAVIGLDRDYCLTGPFGRDFS